MTGHQDHPATGLTLKGEKTKEVDLVALCRAIGVKHVRTVDPHDIQSTLKILKKDQKIFISNNLKK